MRRAERVIFALGALGEAGEAAAHAQRADAVAPAGQDLVRIALMPDVPDQLVLGRVEHIMDGCGELDHAEPGAQMAASDADRADRLLPQFVGQLPELIGGEATQIGGFMHLIEQGRGGLVHHEGPT